MTKCYNCQHLIETISGSWKCVKLFITEKDVKFDSKYTIARHMFPEWFNPRIIKDCKHYKEKQ